MLSTTFMQPFSTSDTRIGHRNESVIMGNCILKLNTTSSTTTYTISFCCKTGLVGNLAREYLCASPDYLLIVKNNGVNNLAFAEIKCRTRLHTANIERQLTVGSDVWVEVNASSDMFKYYVKSLKERIQLLHQAATLQMQRGLLLIGDREGNIIRGIWIIFDDELLNDYCICLAEIHNKNFEFIRKALEGLQEIQSYIDRKTRFSIDQAIEKQEYVDYESFIYNLKYWVSFRRQSLPLRTSKMCIPTIASTWNRSKNGSDVATGIMRDSWYPLPVGCRTPSAVVIQRIIFLISINIMKIATFLTFKNDRDGFESIDQFRTRSKKMFGSHRAFLLHMRKKCIIPMMEQELHKLHEARNVILPTQEPITPTRDEDNPKECSRIITRATARTVHIPIINDPYQITNTTPTSRANNTSKIENRVLHCQNPHIVRIIGEGKKCIRCKRKTKTFCLGCHQFMCVTVARNDDIDVDCATRFQDNPSAINFCLGQKKTRIQLKACTSNGKRKRKEVVKDINLSIQATCYNVIHRHILEKTSQQRSPT